MTTVEELFRLCAAKGYGASVRYYNTSTDVTFKNLKSFYGIHISGVNTALTPTPGILVFGETLNEALSNASTALLDVTRGDIIF